LAKLVSATPLAWVRETGGKGKHRAEATEATEVTEGGLGLAGKLMRATLGLGCGNRHKGIYLALRNITKKWKNPLITWKLAATKLAIRFGQRFFAVEI
jgi:hypothetical protein